MRIRIDVVAIVGGRRVQVTFYPDGEVSEEQISERIRRSFYREVPFTYRQVALEDGVL